MCSPSRAPWAAFAVVFLALGVALRAVAVREQVPCDDELVSIHTALIQPYEVIFNFFSHSYYSIPHTLLLKLFSDLWGLDELTIRLPSLLAGVATLCAPLWLVRRSLGPAAAGICTALLAVSPLLVLYSRVSRAYGLAIALVLVALLALARWLEEQRPRDAALYVGGAVLAIWVHQLSAPALLAPLATASLLAARGAAPGERLRRLLAPLALGAAVGVLAAALLWNPIFATGGQLAAKAGKAEVHAATLGRVLELFAGTGRPWLVGVFWGSAALGAATLLRRHFRVAALLLTSLFAQWIAVAALAPFIAEVPRIFARYVVWTLPLVLLFAALAVAELARWRIGGRDWPLPMLAGSALALALYLFGPLPETYRMPGNFTTHVDYQDLLLDEDAGPAVSEFYWRLREEPGDFAIAEAPWQNSRWMIPYHHFQRVHRRPVRIGFAGRLLAAPNPDELALGDPRVAFRTFVDLADPAALRRAGIRYVVLHRDLGAEVGYPTLSMDLSPVIAWYAQHVGQPVFEDATISVFALR